MKFVVACAKVTPEKETSATGAEGEEPLRATIVESCDTTSCDFQPAGAAAGGQKYTRLSFVLTYHSPSTSSSCSTFSAKK